MIDIDINRVLRKASQRQKSKEKVEQQKAQWDNGMKDLKLQRRALQIFDRLSGKRFSVDWLSHKYFDIYILYLVEAAKKRGYELLNPMRYPWFIYSKET